MTAAEKRGAVRVLLAKVGLDGHDRGIKIVARALMDAGMEVIYTGLRSTPEAVVRAAVQEDVDVVGLSFLAGDHMILAPRVVAGLREHGRSDVRVVLGGVILKQDITALRSMGVAEVFVPGTPVERIVQFIANRQAQA
ncbi:MAG: methylmalonyl-CoA mutase [Betaproteobacteria bacterium RIFCSPLOWO2_02_FULL_65_24]|nr:MAG: methylmalonyl-CoA mutase [Betaproteobacteria bacterium RIFCSPLOWO2_02_FULL_65_24]OGA30805.1 MAG: methylmalonyl-CoA mutase [Betaproteobacteria bacterium RIFCSPLOWO2_12_FULL_62_13b]